MSADVQQYVRIRPLVRKMINRRCWCKQATEMRSQELECLKLVSLSHTTHVQFSLCHLDLEFMTFDIKPKLIPDTEFKQGHLGFCQLTSFNDNILPNKDVAPWSHLKQRLRKQAKLVGTRHHGCITSLTPMHPSLWAIGNGRVVIIWWVQAYPVRVQSICSPANWRLFFVSIRSLISNFLKAAGHFIPNPLISFLHCACGNPLMFGFKHSCTFWSGFVLKS